MARIRSITFVILLSASVQGESGSGSQTDVASGEWASGDGSLASIQPASHTSFQFDDQYPQLTHMKGHSLLKYLETVTYGGGADMYGTGANSYDWTAPMPTALFNLIAPPAWSHLPGDTKYINTFQELVAFQGEGAMRLMFDYCYNKSKIVSDPNDANAEVGWIEMSIGYYATTSRNLRCVFRRAGTTTSWTNSNPTYPKAQILHYFKDPAYLWAPAPPPAPPRGYAQVYAVPTSCMSNQKDFGDGACHPVNNPCLLTCSNSYFSGDETYWPYPAPAEPQCQGSTGCCSVFCINPGTCTSNPNNPEQCSGTTDCDKHRATDGTPLGFAQGCYSCDCRADAPTATKRFTFMWWGISDFSNVYVDYTFTGSNSIRYVQAMNGRAHTGPENRWKRLDLTITHSLGTSTFSTSERINDQIGSWEYEWGLREDLGTTYHDVTNIRVNPIPLLDSGNKNWLGIERIAFFVDVLNPMPPAPPLSDCCAACASMAQAEDWDDYVCLEPPSPPMPPQPPPPSLPPAPPMDTVAYYEHTYNYTYELSPQGCVGATYQSGWTFTPGHYITQSKAIFSGLQACLDAFEISNPAHVTQNMGYYLRVNHAQTDAGSFGAAVFCCPGHMKKRWDQGVTLPNEKLFRVTFHPKVPPPVLPLPAAPTVTERNCADGLPWPVWGSSDDYRKIWDSSACTAANSAPALLVHGWTISELDAGANPCNVVYDACTDECHPNGKWGAERTCSVFQSNACCQTGGLAHDQVLVTAPTPAECGAICIQYTSCRGFEHSGGSGCWLKMDDGRNDDVTEYWQSFDEGGTGTGEIDSFDAVGAGCSAYDCWRCHPGCPRTYCDSYASGGAYASRCTENDQFTAHKECAKTCGMCDGTKTTDSHNLYTDRFARVAQYAACGGFPYYVTTNTVEEQRVFFPSFVHTWADTTYRTYEIFSETHYRRITCDMFLDGCKYQVNGAFQPDASYSPNCLGRTVTKQEVRDAGYYFHTGAYDVKAVIRYAWERNIRYVTYGPIQENSDYAATLCYGPSDPQLSTLKEDVVYAGHPLSPDRNVLAGPPRTDVRYYEITPVTAPPPPPPLPAANSYFTSDNAKEQCGIFAPIYPDTNVAGHWYNDASYLSNERCFKHIGGDSVAWILAPNLKTKVRAKLGTELATCTHYEVCVVAERSSGWTGFDGYFRFQDSTRGDLKWINFHQNYWNNYSPHNVHYSPEYFREDISGSLDSSNIRSTWAFNQARCGIGPRVINGVEVDNILIDSQDGNYKDYWATTLRCVSAPSPPPPSPPPPLPPPPITDATITSCSTSSEYNADYLCANSYDYGSKLFIWCGTPSNCANGVSPEDAMYSTAYIEWTLHKPNMINTVQLANRGDTAVYSVLQEHWTQIKLTITHSGGVNSVFINRAVELCTTGWPGCANHQEWTTMHYLNGVQAFSDVEKVRADVIHKADPESPANLGLKVKFSYREIAPFAPPPPPSPP